MKLRLPTYYKNFQCIAERCTDNCCIGWEICIDKKTEDYYRSVEGSFGKRLCESIKDSSFVLCGERCPFLNDKNLCDIFINLGEDHLCNICAEHPRYYEWFGDKKEGGIGLCCEEAARIILTEGNNTQFFEADIPDEETEEIDFQLYEFLIKARENIFSLLQRNDASIAEKIGALISYAEAIQDGIDFSELENSEPEETEFQANEADIKAFVSAFEDFEPIDEVWTKSLEGLEDKKPEINEEYLNSIFIYFVWRYFMKAVFDGDVLSKINLAAISTAMIALIAKDTTLESYVNAAKLYSKEIEYSEENLALMQELCYTERGFSAENLIALLS